MTNEEIDIAEIATKIMGWKFKTIDENTPLRHCTEDGGYILSKKCYRFIIGYSTVEWNPKENIAHAFEVVEKMRENKLEFRLRYWHSSIDSKWQWFAQFSSEKRGLYFESKAATPAMAICLAALQAMKGFTMTNEEIDRLITERVFGVIIPEGHDVIKYSTNIIYAFKVVEKMREKGWRFFLEDSIQAEGPMILNACFQYAGTMAYGLADIDNPAMAICFAALQAMKGSEP